MESAFSGNHVAQCGNEVTPAVACPHLSLSAAHISWYKLIRKMPFIGPLKAPCKHSNLYR